jgi:lysozyme
MRATLLSLSVVCHLCATALAQDTDIPEDWVPSGSQIELLDSPLGAAETNAAKSLIPLALDLIILFEGWRAKAYNDPVGYCTIGYGHLLDYKSCNDIALGEFSGKISRKKGKEILTKDTAGARITVRNAVNVDLSEAQFGALVSFVFNVGSGNFQKSTLLNRLNQSDYDSAARQFRRWIYAKGKPLSGLTKRRGCEEALFRDVLDQDGNGIFEYTDCEIMGVADTVIDPIDIEEGEK